MHSYSFQTASGKDRLPFLGVVISTRYGFCRIWRLDLETNHLQQMLGTGSPGFTGDGRIIPAPEANLNTPTGVQVADQVLTIRRCGACLHQNLVSRDSYSVG